MKVQTISTSAVFSKILTDQTLTHILSNIDDIFNDKEDFLPGWQSYIKFQKSFNHANHFLWFLAGGDHCNHGTYAEVKLDTLDKIAPNYYHTGSTNMQDLLTQLPAKDNSDLITDLKNISHPSSIPMSLHQRIKNDFGLALMYGAIRIPIIHHTPYETETYEIEIAFSGGSQEQDLIFAFKIFREVQEALWQTHENSWFTYLLKPLLQDQRCHFTIDLLGLKEKLPK